MKIDNGIQTTEMTGLGFDHKQVQVFYQGFQTRENNRFHEIVYHLNDFYCSRGFVKPERQ